MSGIAALSHVTDFRVNAAGQITQTMRHDELIEFREYDAIVV
ncbi:hypothetical protein ACFSC1_06045 [Paracoccus aurantiacus]|nr:hypothetical protein [Paracoccus aurantiacus]